MNLLDSPFFLLFGICVMAGAGWCMLRIFPLLEVEKRAHKDSLPLDGLRGLLASSVVFHHAYIWYRFERTGEWVTPASRLYAQLGPAAVTMFFFVSGYLFWDKTLRWPERITWQTLLPNRLRRIAPAYLLSTLVIVLSALSVAHFHLREPVFAFGKECLQWIAFGFPHLSGPNVNGVDQEIVSAGVFWTLRMEWIFYALLPLLLFARKGRRFVLLLAGAALCLVLAARLERSAIGHLIPGALLLARRFLRMFLVGFAVGMITAYRPLHHVLRRWLLSRWAALVATLGLVVELHSRSDLAYSLVQSLLLAPMFYLVAAGNSFGGLLTSRAMRALGQVSYSIYILHGVLLFDLLTAWNDRHPIARMAPASYASLVWVLGVLVVIVSTLSYWFVERPFFSNRGLTSQRPDVGSLHQPSAGRVT